MWLITGLGNPGAKYTYNWHNCGFMSIEVLAQRNHISFNKNKFRGEYGQGTISGEKVILLRPQTYMNLSGESVREAMSFFKIEPENLIVLYDDIDLPRGTIRVRAKGGPGTHNGMKSIISQIGTTDFPRIRIGCGPVPEHWDLADFVLSDINKEEQETMFRAFQEAAMATEKMIGEVR
jgi:PTH1 family peptidyl-tRNA hydrolase